MFLPGTRRSAAAENGAEKVSCCNGLLPCSTPKQADAEREEGGSGELQTGYRSAALHLQQESRLIPLRSVVKTGC